VDSSLDEWFRREILVHEAALSNYLRRSWRQSQDVADLRQEIYVKVYESAATARPLSPRAFLFTVAHHMMISRYRRNRVVSIETVGDPQELSVSLDELSPERRVDGRQQLRRLAATFNGLPPRCREVIWLRRVEEMSQKEVAAHLGVSVRTVESHIFKGMRLLADGLADQDASDTPVRHQDRDEGEHGQRRKD
jgi:RNA polymerase sigma factor (sigma-70 family)